MSNQIRSVVHINALPPKVGEVVILAMQLYPSCDETYAFSLIIDEAALEADIQRIKNEADLALSVAALKLIELKQREQQLLQGDRKLEPKDQTAHVPDRWRTKITSVFRNLLSFL
ncbi:hypothetical protein GC176_20875 [bacterium]|nr:hypothetical protein [bacterium]